MMKIKYKKLLEYDIAHNADTRTKVLHQMRAEMQNAPLNAICYRNGHWITSKEK